jgi:hypothetical protein
MADKSGLKLIGWMFGGVTAAVMLIAALLVHDAIANPAEAPQDHSAAYALRGSIR